MSRPDTNVIATEIQSVRDGIKAQFALLSASAKAEVGASYQTAKAQGEAIFHPFHVCFA